MNNLVMPFMCALFALLFAVVGYMVASDWVKMVWQQVRFGKSFYATFEADKEKWEEQKRALESAPAEGAQTNQLPAPGTGQGANEQN